MSVHPSVMSVMSRFSTAHGSYFALDQISFYSMTPMPQTHIGSPGHHLMMVHNHSFAMAVGELAPPSGGEDEQGTLTPPPTYAEAVNSGLNNAGFAPVPQEASVMFNYALESKSHTVFNSIN